MLLGEEGGGHEHGHLAPPGHGEVGRAHGYLCFSEADVSADQAIHGSGRGHVLEHGGNGPFLVVRLLEGEGTGKALVVCVRGRESVASPELPAGVDIEKLGGDVPDLFRGLASGLLPLL